MAPKPPTLPQPPSELSHIARVVKMMVSAIQQHNVTKAQN